MLKSDVFISQSTNGTHSNDYASVQVSDLSSMRLSSYNCSTATTRTSRQADESVVRHVATGLGESNGGVEDGDERTRKGS
jgi:hypothetical protein